MAGEIFYMVKAAEAKNFKKDPESIWDLERDKVAHLDMGIRGYELDAALSELSAEGSLLHIAVAGGDDIGGPSCHIRYLAPGKVKDIASELEGVDMEELHNAFCRMNPSGDEGFEGCRECFQDLVALFKEASRKKMGIVKTIY